jgi:hypothetical protein
MFLFALYAIKMKDPDLFFHAHMQHFAKNAWLKSAKLKNVQFVMKKSTEI